MKKHKFSETRIKIHNDGSATVHHMHETDPSQDVEHAVADTDGIHDSLQQHLNPEEAESEIKARGMDPEALEEAADPGIHDRILQAARMQ